MKKPAYIAGQPDPIRTIGDPKMGRFQTDIEIANGDDLGAVRLGFLTPDKVRRVAIKGVVDSGAAQLVLPSAIVKQLGLPITGKVNVRYADGRRAVRKTAEGARLRLLGREDTFKVIVEPKRKTALIGAIVFEQLDLLVDCNRQRLLPRDPRYPIAEID